ncbi:uncharacterized protein FOMMEDRAFT_145214 [Fomitiporia mediterranea MF3/22]|uniref:uncharacterized protein n=1 Tax=Fomitiporia mediterranea (strain MF3/22) TaxID=694068 RepID=UPI0004408290|nr:uncharacterized protein FOMMEDRAFT_145214 [Fomitiporia mediterranea MF3/22]EJD05822.1 hypothetical protein FOMMEDRAFT_145214 [Fomitiporia mediterranea MF3/22]
MRFCYLPLPLLSLLASPVLAAGPHWSLAEDFYAFPKYRVAFLNGLPVLNETAQRWLQVGLKGGEPEFLDQPWQERTSRPASELMGIEGGTTERPEQSRGAGDLPHSSPYRLERMNLAGKNSYICLIPPPVESHTKPVEEPQIEATATQSLSLLQPLTNTCIYHRQGWFTYAYCHNSHVRQFREMAHSHPHHAGYVPEEDPEWEAYTLGQAAAAPSEGRDLTVAQQEALAKSVDIVKTAGHRYLVQKMGSGTICDKTGKPREIEVQFHCSQTMTDTILFVKETSTCHYIMVIHTPRLCGEPGFKTRLEQREEAFIRCREVLDSPEAIAAVDKSLPAAPHPFKRPARPPILDIPPPPPVSEARGSNLHPSLDKKASDMIKAAIEAFISGKDGSNQHMHEGGDTILVAGEDGDVLIDIEFIDGDDADDTMEKLEGLLDKASGKLGRLEEALREAGYNVHAVPPTDSASAPEKEEKQGDKASEDEKSRPKHEEL